MSPTAKTLLKQALDLSEGERASIAGALIESLHGPSEPGVDGARDAVIARRVAEIDSGTVATIPWSEVRSQLFDGFE